MNITKHTSNIKIPNFEIGSLPYFVDVPVDQACFESENHIQQSE